MGARVGSRLRLDTLAMTMIATVVVSLGLPVDQAKAAPGHPNIVVIEVDDLDVGIFNTAVSHGLMPNFVTYISRTGTNFLNSFVSDSLCCPSRATFLTGQYAHNHGVKIESCVPFQSLQSTALPTWLQNAPADHYYTGFVGKYLNGYGSKGDNWQPGDPACTNPAYVPPSGGWNDWEVLTNQPQQMWNYWLNQNGTVLKNDQFPCPPCDVSTYQTNELMTRGEQFISTAVGSHGSQPFFLWLTPTAPHLEDGTSQGLAGCNFNAPYGPAYTIRVPSGISHSSDGIAVPNGDPVGEDIVTDKPAYVSTVTDFDQTQPLTDPVMICLQKVYHDQLAALKGIDLLIGGVGQELSNDHVQNNTVIIFTSDNGFFHGEHRLQNKLAPYEESIRVPLIVRYCALGSCPTVPATASDFVINTDLAPTVADIAGATLPTGARTPDGVSFLPLMNLRPMPTQWRQRVLLEHWTAGEVPAIPDYFGVRSENTDPLSNHLSAVFVHYDRGGSSDDTEFYSNLDADRTEMTDQSGGSCTVCSGLDAKLLLMQACSATGTTCQSLEGYMA